jgi:hypothetical protein
MFSHSYQVVYQNDDIYVNIYYSKIIMKVSCVCVFFGYGPFMFPHKLSPVTTLIHFKIFVYNKS